MRNKFFIISFLLFGLYFVPTNAFTQATADSITAAENAVVDTATEMKSYEQEDYNAVQKPSIEFSEASLDTAIIVVRASLNDSLEKVKKQTEYQYALIENEERKNVRERKENSSNSSFISSATFSFLFWFITIGFLVVVIVIYALDGNFKVFTRRRKYITTTSEDDVFSLNIFDLDYTKLIKQATDNADYNRAVRLGFLKILTILSSKKIVDYGIEKTNFDYQFQLINTKYYQDFLLAANYYEYAWYAGIIINNNQYNKIVESYKSFEQQIN